MLVLIVQIDLLVSQYIVLAHSIHFPCGSQQGTAAVRDEVCAPWLCLCCDIAREERQYVGELQRLWDVFAKDLLFDAKLPKPSVRLSKLPAVNVVEDAVYMTRLLPVTVMRAAAASDTRPDALLGPGRVHADPGQGAAGGPGDLFVAGGCPGPLVSLCLAL